MGNDDGDYTDSGGEDSLPETPDIRCIMLKGAQTRPGRVRKAQLEVCSCTMLRAMAILTCCNVVQALNARGAKKMARDVDCSVVLDGKRSRSTTAAFVAGPAGIIKRKRATITLPKSRFNDDWWVGHLEQRATTLTSPSPAAHGPRVAPAIAASRQRRAVRTKAQIAEDTVVRIRALEEAAGKVQLEFLASFSYEERQLIAAQAYHSERLAIAQQNRSMAGSVTPATNVAARAAFVCSRTAENWMHDHANNNGWFSTSNWGAFPKMASLVGDIETKHWAREWVVKNMGHKSGKKNKVTRDFQEALHGYLGLEYSKANPTICESACRSLLKCVEVGARWTVVKQGYTHNDNHGADHVVFGQRPAFLSLYQQLYDRGPNFLPVGDKWEDKDGLIGTSKLYTANSSLLLDDRCIGPRGIHMGGCVNPENASKVLPFAKAVDFPGRIWHLMCHDEACVHTLKGERCCWLIPGVDMGDIPPKSDGEFEHLAEVDSELTGGTLSLDGSVGQTSRSELREYMKAKREGRLCKIPCWSSIRMHGGAAGEGYWLGDDAKMQFELILDIFDVKFNMPWIIDPLEATTMDLAAVTDVQRAAFQHGLAVQGDRSQGHLKMAVDCTNANKIRKNPGGLQPHFRHTFSPLPQGYTHWRQCRLALCTDAMPGQPPCPTCQEAVLKFGDNPTFQSVGRKGSQIVLAEMGIGQQLWAPFSSCTDRLAEDPSELAVGCPEVPNSRTL